MSSSRRKALIVAAYGRHFVARTDNNIELTCVTRGKKTNVVCGDRVEITQTSANQGIIEKIEDRTSLFMRADNFRTKAIAANVTQIAVVVAPKPSWSMDFLQRCLLAAESQNLRALIIANKSDLPYHKEMLTKLEPFASLGYGILSLCAKQDISVLRNQLKGMTTLLVGQSGMGKSTLINRLHPDAEAKVADISESLDSGRHTTTHTRLYQLDEGSSIIDSPGFQEFALAHLSFAEIENAMPEFRPYIGQCKFRDCRHTTEPQCALQEAVKEGNISGARLRFFHSVSKKQDL